MLESAMTNSNPSPETRFKPGCVGNPGGKTSEQKKAEVANAEKAVALRSKVLDAIAKRFEGMSDSELVESMDQQFLKMLKDAEDRGLGAPVQPITSPDGSLRPSVIELVGVPIPDDQSTD